MIAVAALYRLSSKKSLANKLEGEADIPAQKKAIANFVATHPDWRLVSEYEEKGVSAYKKTAEQRNVLQELLRDARAGQWQALLVFKEDRLSRQGFGYLDVLNQLWGAGIEVWSVADNKLLSMDDEQLIIRAVEAHQSLQESKKTSLRVRYRMNQLAESGKWTGGWVPFGYDLKPKLDQQGRPVIRGNRVVQDLVPNEWASVVAEVFARYNAGQGTGTLAAWLNTQGAKTVTGGLWHRDGVRWLLQKPVYAGLVSYNRTRGTQTKGAHPILADGFHPAIVDRETWELAQQVRGHRREERVRPRSASNPYPLSGVILCSVCGAKMGGITFRQQRKRTERVVLYSYYRCSDHRRTSTCKTGVLPAREIEEAFIAALEQQFTAPTAIRTFLEEREKAAGTELKAAQLARRRMQERLKEIEGALKRLDRAYLEAGTIDDAEYAEKKRGYHEERRSLEAELARPVATEETRDVDALVELVKQLRILWYDDDTTPEERKTIALSIVKSWRLRAIVHPDKRVEILPA